MSPHQFVGQTIDNRMCTVCWLVDNCTIEMTPYTKLLGPQRTFRDINTVTLPALHFNRCKVIRVTFKNNCEVVTFPTTPLSVTTNPATLQKVFENIFDQALTASG